MSLRGEQEGEVVAAVGNGTGCDGQNIPQRGDREMGAHDQRAQSYGEVVGDGLFQWVTVE